MTVLTDVQEAVTAIVGLVLLLGGGFFTYLEMRTPPVHSIHLYLFVGVAVLGALIIRPDPIFAVVQRALALAKTTSLPFIGGKGGPT